MAIDQKFIGLEWSPDNTQLIWYLSTNPYVAFWDIKTQKLARKVELFPKESITCKLSFQWSDDGKTLKGILGRHGFWDAKSEKWTRPLQPEALYFESTQR